MVPENQATSARRYNVHVIEFTVPSLPMMGTVSRILIVSDAPTHPLAGASSITSFVVRLSRRASA